MKSPTAIAALAAAAAAAVVCACATPNIDGDAAYDESAVEAVDPLEGAYAKQGGTPVHFVFRRGDPDEEDLFFGEIEVSGEAQRAEGTARVGRDKYGTTLTMTPQGSKPKAKPKEAGAAETGATAAAEGAEAGAPPADSRPIVEQAFSGTVHFLKIGKNDTLLVRGDENGKTAQYKKLRTWCGVNAEADCAPEVQRTGLDCPDTIICTTTSKCACGTP